MKKPLIHCYPLMSIDWIITARLGVFAMSTIESFIVYATKGLIFLFHTYNKSEYSILSLVAYIVVPLT